MAGKLKYQRRTLDVTRTELLEAARAHLVRHGMATPLPLNMRAVAESIGHTAGAAYGLWPKQIDFQRALTRELINGDENLPPIDADNASTFENAVATLIKHELTRRSNALFVLHHHFVAVAVQDLEVRAWLHARRNREHQVVEQSLSSIMERFNLEPAAPFDVSDIAASLSALLDGAAARWHIDPAATATTDRANSLPFAAAIALLSTFTTPTHPPR